MTAGIFAALIQVVLLIAVTYVVVFGGIGAVLARSRGGGALWGFVAGVAVPFVGWGWVAWRTRDGDAEPRAEPTRAVAPPAASAAAEQIEDYY